MKKKENKIDYQEHLNVGFIQTNLDEKLAWFNIRTGKWNLPMSATAQIKMVQEIQQGFCDVVNYSNKPDFIILPEVTLPIPSEKTLEMCCLASKAIVIAGLDFIMGKKGIQNKAVIMVPDQWPSLRKSRHVSKYYFGKTHFSIPEKKLFNDIGLSEEPDQATYLFHAHKFGKIGVAICSDFFDLERFVIYRGKIQHLFVISHNQDTESYYFLAEAISRLVFCNVVICNTGFYGDSIAFSPYDKSFKRYIYRHKGQNLFATQVIKLPVKDLIEAQMLAPNKSIKSQFKAPPPGYRYDK